MPLLSSRKSPSFVCDPSNFMSPSFVLQATLAVFSFFILSLFLFSNFPIHSAHHLGITYSVLTVPLVFLLSGGTLQGESALLSQIIKRVRSRLRTSFIIWPQAKPRTFAYDSPFPLLPKCYWFVHFARGLGWE